MGPPRFELESEDPQSPRMPGYPTIPCRNYIGRLCLLGFLSFPRNGALYWIGFIQRFIMYNINYIV